MRASFSTYDYRMWTPPTPCPPHSATPSPSKSVSSLSESEDESQNRMLSSTLSNIPVSHLSHGDEARYVIFLTDDRQWKLPLKPFFEKSVVLREFIASPLNASTHFDHDLDHHGTQLIRLSNVESMEVEEFFNALYNADAFEPAPAPTSLNTVLGVLKLSTLYQVKFLRKRALVHLSLAYPTTLEHWDTRHLRACFPLGSAGSHENMLYYATPAETLEIIKTAYDSDALWVLPSALYECCKYDKKSLVCHPMFSDGTIDLELQIKILVGYTEQVELTMKEVLSFLRIPSTVAKRAGCVQPHKCADARMEVEETALSWVKQWPLEVWSEHSWDDEQTRAMCRTCRRTCEDALMAGRNRAWASLPEIFRLPSWQRLEELKEEGNI